MIFEYGSPQIFAGALFLLFLGGIATFTFGRRAPRALIWVNLGLMLLLLISIGFSLWERVHTAAEAEVWLRGWILPNDDPGAVTVGITLDFPALVITLATTLIAGLALLSRRILLRETNPGRLIASLAICVAGVAVSWSAMTPWLVLVGILIVEFGGFMALGARWEAGDEADAAMRFAWEKLWGLILAWTGLCILAGGRAPLSWNTLAGPASGTGLETVGALLLILGLFVQMQAFPFLGWLLKTSEMSPFYRTLLNQVFPAWAAFAMIVRMESSLRELAVFQVFGWIALGSALLTAIVGLFEAVPAKVRGLWAGAGFSVAFGAIAIAGANSGMALFIGMGLGVIATAAVAAVQELHGSRSGTNLRKMNWAKTAGVLGFLCGVGAAGFVGAGGFAEAFSRVSDNGILLSSLSFVFLLFSLLTWRLIWGLIKAKGAIEAPWGIVLFPYIFVLAGLGWLWNGTASGGLLPGGTDRVLPGIFSFLSLGEPHEPSASAVTVYLALFVFSLIVSFWLGGRDEDLWGRLRKAMPRLSRFVSRGYGVETAGSKILSGIQWFGRVSESWRVEVLPSSAAARAISAGLRRAVMFLAGIDARFSTELYSWVGRGLDLPARGLQFIQTGNVQWYLAMGLGSGIGILLYFLRT